MDDEKVLKSATVCFLIKEDRILLAHKTEKIGAGFLNGYGGGIEKGEQPIMAAIRELKEETGKNKDRGVIAQPEHLEKIAILDAHNTMSDGHAYKCQVHIYLVRHWQGKIEESETMIKPAWYDIKNLPWDKMMPADKDWLPTALSGQKVIAKVWYGPWQKILLKETEVEILTSFPNE